MGHPIILLLRHTWKYAKGKRHIFILYISFFVIANTLYLLEPVVIGKMFNIIQQGGDPSELWRNVLKYLLIMLVLPFGFWAFHGPARVMERKTSFYIEMNYKRELLKKAFSLPLSWHRDHHSGENIDKINRASQALHQFSGNLFEIVENTTRLIVAYTALFFIVPLAAVTAITVSIITIATIVLYDRIIVKQYLQMYVMENKVASAVHDYISNIVTVISMRLEKISLDSITKKILNIFPLFRKNSIINEVKWFTVSAIIALMTLLVLGGHIYFTLKSGNVLLVGTLYTLYAYLEKIAGTFYNIAWKYGQIVEQSSSVKAVNNIEKAFNKHKILPAYELPDGWQTIQIRNVYFTHVDEEKHRHHVENLNMVINSGARIALVGASGGGKSTIMSLLRGIHHTVRGRVFVDGKKMPYGFQHIYDYTTLIPQEPEIFSDTIRYNITMGLHVSGKELGKALHMSRFRPALNRLKKGLSAHIAEKGVNLSGGEKQRLALARGLLSARNRPIILMDEPTSSVDSRNEICIYERIFSQYPEKTIIASVHRLHLLKMFDYIYLIDDGKIIEEGNLDDLLSQKGVFYNSWKEYFKTHNRLI